MTKSFARGVKPITERTILGFFESLDTPLSLSCWLMYKYGEHSDLVKKTISPMDYNSPERFRLDYCAVKFLSKCTFLKTGIDKKRAAMLSFIDAEMSCRDTNERLAPGSVFHQSSHLLGGKSLRFDDICHRLTGKMATVLRSVPDRRVLDDCRFGPGSTTRVKGTKTSAYEKLRESLHTTREALHILPSFFREYPRFPREFSLVKGNHVTFVPKNAKTDRSIAIEPDLNIFVQLGIGEYIRKGLARVGVDLLDQTRNQRLADQASRTGLLATIDMSSASDLISQGALMSILPVDWYVLLDHVRSHHYMIEDKWYYYHKFSSMGNGFTFPLQSLVFWSFSSLACDLCGCDSGDIGVYGDDLIIPVEAYSTLLSLLSLFGFRVNSAKSFSSGPFRESCGKDYFDGVDCQPVYLREEVNSVLELYKVHNAISALAQRFSLFGWRDIRFESLCKLIRRHCPHALRFSVPPGFGDGGFVSSFDEARPTPVRAKRGWEGWFFMNLSFSVSKYAMVDSDATFHFALMSAGSPNPSLGRASHRRRGIWKKRRVLASQWPTLGGWV